MNTHQEVPRIGQRDSIWHRIVFSIIDAVDPYPPRQVRHVETFGEFEDLSTKFHAEVIDVLLLTEEVEPNTFSPSISYSSWRENQRDKVVFRERYAERFRRDFDPSADETIQLKFALTAEQKLSQISWKLPKAEIRAKVSEKRIKGPGNLYSVDLESLDAFYHEAVRLGLAPLTPIPPVSSSTPGAPIS